MAVILSVLGVFAILVASEFYWRKRIMHGEFSRKFVHITVGSFVAFWPYFLTKSEIIGLSAAFIVAVVASKYLHIFKAIHSVQRPTIGEIWFALVVGVLAFTLGHPHIYTAALLEMSLADGLAAVVGTRFGHLSRRYTVFGAPKSIIGTTTFFIVSCAILTGYVLQTPNAMSAVWIVPISLVATLIENVAVRGLDNIAVPLFIALALMAFM